MAKNIGLPDGFEYELQGAIPLGFEPMSDSEQYTTSIELQGGKKLDPNTEYGRQRLAEKSAGVERARNASPDYRSFGREVLGPSIDAFATAAEIPINAATLGSYNWLNEKLGGTAKERREDLAIAMSSAPRLLRAAGTVGNLVAEIGGSVQSPAVRAISGLGAGRGLAARALGGATSGAALGATRAGFDTDFNPYSMGSSALIGGAIGGAAPIVMDLGARAIDAGRNIAARNLVIPEARAQQTIIDVVDDPRAMKALRTSALTGNEQVRSTAGGLSERLGRIKGAEQYSRSTIDSQLDDMLRTPELAQAQTKFSNFMRANGGQPISPGAIAQLLKENPTIKPFINEFVRLNPAVARGITPNTLRALETAKQLTGQAAKRVGENIARATAYSGANQAVKNLAESVSPGYRAVNRNLAKAFTGQELRDAKVASGLASITNAVPNIGGGILSKMLPGALGLGGLGGVVLGSPIVAGTGLAAAAGAAGSKALTDMARIGLGNRILSEGMSALSVPTANPATIKQISDALSSVFGTKIREIQ